MELKNQDGLLEYNEQLNFLNSEYNEILKNNYEFLDMIRRVRNKYQHKMHGARVKSSGSGSLSLFDYEFEVDGKTIFLYAGSFIKLVKMINILFTKMMYEVQKYAESGLDKEFISKLNQSNNVLHDLYLTTTPVKYAIEAQEKVIKKIASKGSCVIVGRSADYVLRNNKNIIRIFIYAPEDYRIKSVMEMYGDKKTEDKKNITRSDKNRASYYKMISNSTFGDINNYDLCIDSSIGTEKTTEIICNYINNR